MNNDKPRKLSIEQREQLRAAKIACPNNLNGSDSHYCTRCSTIPSKTATEAEHTILGQVNTDNYLSVHPGHVAHALGQKLPTAFDAAGLLDLLRKLREGAVTDSNRIGELSSQLDEMTGKYNAALEGKNCEAEHNQELRGQVVNLIDERDKAQEDLRKALAERNQARAAFRALAQRVDFDTFCDLLLNWGTDK